MRRAAVALLIASTCAPLVSFQQSAAAAQAAAAFSAPIDPKQRELALAVLERSSRAFAVYCARRGTELTVVVEMSVAAIQAGRWKAGAEIEAVAASADGVPHAKAQAHLDAGTYATSIPLSWNADAAPDRVTVTVRGAEEKPAEEWVRLYPSKDTLVGEPLVWRSANRITTRPVAAFEFARNERARIEWPMLAASDRRAARLLSRSSHVLVPSLTLTEDAERRVLVLDLPMSNLIKGDYLLDLEAAGAGVTERHLLAIRTR